MVNDYYHINITRINQNPLVSKQIFTLSYLLIRYWQYIYTFTGCCQRKKMKKKRYEKAFVHFIFIMND